MASAIPATEGPRAVSPYDIALTALFAAEAALIAAAALWPIKDTEETR